MMENWQDIIAMGIAVCCGVFVLREFVQPFLHPYKCPGCSSCGPTKAVLLKIKSIKE